MTCLLWFRDDLRLHDNQALSRASEAAARGRCHCQENPGLPGHNRDFLARGFTLVEPWEVTNAQGQPYKVFTPFSKAAASQVAGDEPEGVPEMGASASSAFNWPKPTEPAWAASLAEHWTPGEAGARERLAQLDLANYAEERDIPALNATSPLSPHLRFGEVSPREVWFAAAQGLAGRHYGHSACRRRNARAMGHRVYAQSRAHGGGLLPHQEPGHPLASGRGMVLGHLGGRRCRLQSF